MAKHTVRCPACNNLSYSSVQAGEEELHRCPHCGKEFLPKPDLGLTVPDPVELEESQREASEHFDDSTPKSPIRCPKCGEPFTVRDNRETSGRYICADCLHEFSYPYEIEPAEAPRPEPKAPDTTPEGHEDTVLCPGCGAWIGVSEPGEYNCHRCGSIFNYPDDLKELGEEPSEDELYRIEKELELKESGDPEHLGLAGWLFNSFKLIIIKPAFFFRTINPEGQAKSAVIFALILCILSTIIGSFTKVMPLTEQMGFMSYLRSYTLVLLIFTPILAVILLLATTGLFHFFTIVFQCRKYSIATTLRAVGYSSGVLFFWAVPYLGIAAPFWMLVLLIIAIAEMHEAGYAQAIGVVMTPVLIFSCLFGVFFLGAMYGLFAGPMLPMLDMP